MEVCAQEARSKNARKLALKLLSLFFMKEQMAEGLYTPLEGKKLLNPEIIEGIRLSHVQYWILQFPAISENCIHEPISEQLFNTVQEHKPILNHISLYHLWTSTKVGMHTVAVSMW